MTRVFVWGPFCVTLPKVGSYRSIMLMGVMLSRFMTTALVGLLVSGATFGVQAQQPTSSGQQAAANPSGWTFNIAPYGWFASVNVTSNLPLPPALGGTLTTDSSIGFLITHLA
jgi:hypothetical protein